MKHTYHFSEIRTERLLLRELRESDWSSIVFLRTDNEVNRYIPHRKRTNNEAEALAFIRKISLGIQEATAYYWAMVLLPSDEMIGSICLWNFSDDRKSAEVGFDLSPAYHKKGLMSEALQALLNLGFHSLELEQIEAYTHKDNNASIKLLTNHGFILNTDKKDEMVEHNLVFELSRDGF